MYLLVEKVLCSLFFLQVWFDPQDCKSMMSTRAEAGVVYFVPMLCTVLHERTSSFHCYFFPEMP